MSRDDLYKIAVVIQTEQWGGLYTIVERAGPIMPKFGYEWHIILPDHAYATIERLTKNGLSVWPVPLSRLRRTLDVRVHFKYLYSFYKEVTKIAEVCDTIGASCVQVNGTQHLQGVFAAWKKHRPLIWQLHSNSAPFLLRALYSPLVTFGSKAVMTSGSKLNKSFPTLSLAQKKITPFYAPVDVDKFVPDSSDQPALGTTTRNRVVIGTVGVRTPVKNHQLIVKAAAILCSKYDNIAFQIVGEDRPNSRNFYRKHVIKLAKDYGLLEGGRVQFVEPEGDMAGYYTQFDIFVQTSRAEGISIVLAEAMACSLPVVATDVGSKSDLIDHGDNGYLVPSNSVSQLVDSLEELILNPEQRKRMGEKGLAKAKTLTSEYCAQIHASVYGRILFQQK